MREEAEGEAQGNEEEEENRLQHSPLPVPFFVHSTYIPASSLRQLAFQTDPRPFLSRLPQMYEPPSFARVFVPFLMGRYSFLKPWGQRWGGKGKRGMWWFQCLFPSSVLAYTSASWPSVFSCWSACFFYFFSVPHVVLWYAVVCCGREVVWCGLAWCVWTITTSLIVQELVPLP